MTRTHAGVSELPGPGTLPESRFFQPTERCPNPERWSSTCGESTEVQVSRLIAALVVATQPDVVIETGTAFGETAIRIALALKANGHGRLYTIEPDPARQRYALERMPPSANWTLIDMPSLEWTPPFERGACGFLFCDSATEARIPEVIRFRPWLRKGAIVAVHDSAWDGSGLRGQLELALVDTGIVRAIDLPTPRGLTLCEVL